MKRTQPHIIRAREAHHEALKAMMPLNSKATGLQVWRKLRLLEAQANSMACKQCSGEITTEEMDTFCESVTLAVKRIFGNVPPGFFVNRDPRGYALKLEAGSVPYALHEDWGRYQILAPEIN